MKVAELVGVSLSVLSKLHGHWCRQHSICLPLPDSILVSHSPLFTFLIFPLPSTLFSFLPLSLFLPPHHLPSLSLSQTEEASQLYPRLYLSLMMHRLLSMTGPQTAGGGTKEVGGVWSVVEHFQCSRGFLQSSISTFSSFASCLVHFTQVYSFNYVWPCDHSVWSGDVSCDDSVWIM